MEDIREIFRNFLVEGDKKKAKQQLQTISEHFQNQDTELWIELANDFIEKTYSSQNVRPLLVAEFEHLYTSKDFLY